MLDAVERTLVDRYLAGECTPAEAERANTILTAHPEERAAIGLALEQLDAQVPASPRSAQHSFQVLRARLGGTEPGLGVPAAPWAGNSMPRHWAPLPAVGARATRPLLALAAAVVVALAAGLVVRHGARRASPSREYVTAAGERLSATLIDGTQLTLAPASRVRVAADYGRGTREIHLLGEAYFTVQHDPARPFIVHAGQARATDLGTQFDVRAYPGDDVASIVVVQGRVDVGPDRPAMDGLRTTLAAGERALVDAVGRAGAAERVDATALTSWRDGRLAYHNVPLSTVVADLAHWYDLDIVLASPELAAQPVTSDWTNIPSRELVAELAAAVGARAERHGKHIVLTIASLANH
jgi:transmembrane sensor